MTNTSKSIIVNISGHASGSFSATASLSATAGMAQLWFQDALVVSKNPDPSVRRHEVVFSSCFVEAWLYEWVRDVVVPVSPVVIDKHILKPKVRKKPIRDRWSEVLNLLHQKALVVSVPPAGSTGDFDKLLDVRNALVHAETSRQYPVHPPDGKTYGDVMDLAPGWALRVATDQAETLRSVTKPEHLARWPSWMKLP